MTWLELAMVTAVAMALTSDLLRQRRYRRMERQLAELVTDFLQMSDMRGAQLEAADQDILRLERNQRTLAQAINSGVVDVELESDS